MNEHVIVRIQLTATVAYPGIVFGGSNNSVEDRRQRERESGDGSAYYANE
jgi:hypothetical protein